MESMIEEIQLQLKDYKKYIFYPKILFKLPVISINIVN